jgi:hypothetical protein
MNGGGFSVYGCTRTPTHTVILSKFPAAMNRLLPIMFVLFLLACGRSSPEAERWATADMAADIEIQDEYAPSSGSSQATIDRKIIRSGSLTLEVDDLVAARNEILKRTKASGGFLERDAGSEWESTRSITVSVRIPADRFDSFVDGVGTLGRLEHRNIDATDVTTEWVDVEARLAAKRKVEERYLELAAQAKNVAEMLEVQRELGNVRAEIESMEARMESLRGQVAMSTLTITCNMHVAVSERFAPKFGVALHEGWNNLLRFAVGVTNIWPFVIVIGVLVWWWRRRRAKRGK